MMANEKNKEIKRLRCKEISSAIFILW